MIDLAALALAPGIAAFGRPVVVTPPTTTPPTTPFQASGVWSVRNVDIGLEAGESLNTTTITLGIRLSDWAVAPRRGMSVGVPAAGGLPAEGTLWIDDVDEDGQGGAKLTLKRQAL